MLTTEFAVNVVLRDTIERLYPHVLLKRAVEDIQVRVVSRYILNPFLVSTCVINAVGSAQWYSRATKCDAVAAKLPSLA
jgi:hypothetical protein